MTIDIDFLSYKQGCIMTIFNELKRDLSPNFHTNALQAGIIALFEGKFDNSDYVRKLAYELYEEDNIKYNESKKYEPRFIQ